MFAKILVANFNRIFELLIVVSIYISSGQFEMIISHFTQF